MVRLARWAFWFLVLALVVFNVWWAGREAQPVPSLSKVASWIDQKRYAEADLTLRSILRRSPYDDEARMLYARSLAARNQLHASAEQLHRVPAWSPRKKEALYLEGSAWSQLGLMTDAEDAWRKVVSPDALHPPKWGHFKSAIEQLLDLYAVEERWDEAHDVIWRMYEEVDPSERLNVLWMMLRTEVERIETDVARGVLERYVAADPADLFARRALARTCEAQKDTDAADRQIEYCLRHWPEDPGVWRDWLEMLIGRGQVARFLEEVAKLPSAADHDGNIWNARGHARDSVHDWKGAAEAYRKALELLPFDGEVQYRLGMAEQRLGNKEAALPHLKRSRVLEDARGRLFNAVFAFRAAATSEGPQGPTRIQRTTDLAEICRTLGYERLANELLDTIELPPGPVFSPAARTSK